MARVTDGGPTARAGAAVPRRLGAHERGREVGASDVRDVRCRPARGARRRLPPLRLRRAEEPGERPPRLLEGPRVDASVRDLPRRGRRLRRGAPRTTASTGACSRATRRRVIPWVDVATGSLGQGLPIGVGMALAAKQLEQLPSRVWVLCGDSEMAEGSMWEAFEHAAHFGLDNLTAIIDVNRLGQRGETMVGWNLDTYVARAEAFGWNAIEVDGHDVEAIDEAFAAGGRDDRQADGRRRAHDEGQGRRGGREPERLPRQAARRPRRGDRRARRAARHPHRGREAGRRRAALARRASALELPRYELGTEVATRKAYGDALAALGAARPDVVALDGEVSNSTFAETFAKAHPERYFEMYIAEQQMVAAAVGLQAVGWRPFASTFAAFLSRAYDFVRMAAISRATLRALRLARRRLDRRGRPVADGARGHRVAPRGPRVDRAPPVRREPDGEARRSDGRDGRHLVPADAPAGDAGSLLAGRGVRDRRQPRPPLERRRRGRADRRRDHGPRGAEGRRRAGRGGHRGARDRPLLDQAARRRDARAPQPRRPAGGSSPSRTTGPRAASAMRCSTALSDTDEPPRVVKLAVREHAEVGEARGALAAPGSTPSTSRPPRDDSSPLALSRYAAETLDVG